MHFEKVLMKLEKFFRSEIFECRFMSRRTFVLLNIQNQKEGN